MSAGRQLLAKGMGASPGVATGAIVFLSEDAVALAAKGTSVILVRTDTTSEDVPGMRRAGSGDWAGLFNLYYWIDRESGVGGMLLTQVLPFFDAGVVQAFVELEATVYAQVGAVGAA